MKYYKHKAESELGEGLIYLEIDENGYVNRQVEIYGTYIFWADAKDQKDDRFIVADQKIDVSCFNVTNKINREKFDRLWKDAKKNG